MGLWRHTPTALVWQYPPPRGGEDPRGVANGVDTGTEISRRIQAGASAWRKVGRVMGDRHISWKLKGNMLSSYITPAYLYGLEIMTMTEKQQEKLQVCENNWVRRIAGVKGIDKGRMGEPRDEVGEEPAKVGWTRGKNGRGTIDEIDGYV